MLSILLSLYNFRKKHGNTCKIEHTCIQAHLSTTHTFPPYFTKVTKNFSLLFLNKLFHHIKATFKTFFHNKSAMDFSIYILDFLNTNHLIFQQYSHEICIYEISILFFQSLRIIPHSKFPYKADCAAHPLRGTVVLFCHELL